MYIVCILYVYWMYIEMIAYLPRVPNGFVPTLRLGGIQFPVTDTVSLVRRGLSLLDEVEVRSLRHTWRNKEEEGGGRRRKDDNEEGGRRRGKRREPTLELGYTQP